MGKARFGWAYTGLRRRGQDGADVLADFTTAAHGTYQALCDSFDLYTVLQGAWGQGNPNRCGVGNPISANEIATTGPRNTERLERQVLASDSRGRR